MEFELNEFQNTDVFHVSPCLDTGGTARIQFYTVISVLAPSDRLQAPWEVHALGPAEEGRRFVSCRHGAMRGNAEKLVGQVARFIYKPNSMTSVLAYPSPPCRA